MCGIAGSIFQQYPSINLTDAVVAQAHRGPDHTAVVRYPNAHLGHNRLSIIDLDAHANQPFSDPSDRYVMVFNGEIYNYLEIRDELRTGYTFRTESDTEVLLSAYLKWGAACLDRLNGMFAFAIWDRHTRTLFAARDRFGVKPFYYTHTPGALAFASEIKTLWAGGVPRRPRATVWANYLMYGSYGAPADSFWSGIEQLPAGHCLKYAPSTDTIQIQRWYNFEQRVSWPEHRMSEDELIERYEALLKDSIALRFRADVPVGFNVSGGLDSSALLALVNQTAGGENINAYTFYTGDERYDELPWVNQLLAKTANPLVKVKFETSEVASMAAYVTSHQDEPYGGLPTLAYANLFRQARRDSVIVLLDGQGMDEQWAGYDYYQRRTEATIQGIGHSPFRPEVLAAPIRALATRPQYPQPFDNWTQNTQYRDLFYTKIPRALRFNDRISMAASTELREPFLDYRLVELAFSQPLNHKIRNGQGKYVLRRLVDRLLGKNLAFAPKRPLQTPQREWLQNELAPLVNQKLDALLQSPYAYWFDADAVRAEWRAYRGGNTDSSFHIWQWMSCADYLTEVVPV